MKISQEDPILTAYALGELDESSRAVVEEALMNDESVAREGAAIHSLSGFLFETLQGETVSLGKERRDEIFKSGKLPDGDVLVLDHRRRSRRQSILAVVGVAAVVVVGFLGLSRFQTSGPGVAGGADVARSGGGPSKGESVRLSNIPVTQRGHSIQVPLTIGAADPSFVEKALTETGALPPSDRFKVAEWVNAGRLGASPLLTVANVGVYVELGPCSWDDDQALLLVNLRSLDKKGASVKATLNFNPDKVESSRFLGAVDSPHSVMPLGGMMTDDQTHLYQINLLPGSELVGSIDLKVGDEKVGYLPLLNSPRDEAKVSDDFTTACVFAEFAQWGKSESRDSATLERLATTAKSLLGKITDEKSRYALDMILLSEESFKK